MGHASISIYVYAVARPWPWPLCSPQPWPSPTRHGNFLRVLELPFGRGASGLLPLWLEVPRPVRVGSPEPARASGVRGSLKPSGAPRTLPLAQPACSDSGIKSVRGPRDGCIGMSKDVRGADTMMGKVGSSLIPAQDTPGCQTFGYQVVFQAGGFTSLGWARSCQECWLGSEMQVPKRAIGNRQVHFAWPRSLLCTATVSSPVLQDALSWAQGGQLLCTV